MIVPNNKIPKPFSYLEQKLLNGHHTSIAKKNDSSSAYVGKIASGERAATSEKGKEILESLQKLLIALKSI